VDSAFWIAQACQTGVPPVSVFKAAANRGTPEPDICRAKSPLGRRGGPPCPPVFVGIGLRATTWGRPYPPTPTVGRFIPKPPRTTNTLPDRTAP